jgi:hypothetical protein
MVFPNVSARFESVAKVGIDARNGAARRTGFGLRVASWQPRMNLGASGLLQWSWALVALVVLGCRRTPPEPTEGSAPSASSVEAAPRGPPRFAAPARLVAIGDLHGDLAVTRAALRLSGAIDRDDDWVGGQLVVVQCGDQIDRGDDDRSIIDLLDVLADKAKRAGGALHALNGNHELMNVAGDFRYVTPRGFASFDDLAAPGLERFEPRASGRAAAFLPGSPYARKLAKGASVIVVGDSLFVHGGVRPEHMRHGLGRVNDELAAFMLGEARSVPALVSSEESPLWTRVYGQPEPTAASCAMLGQVLDELGLKRMVIGHTVQETGINAACAERVWRVDVGLSSFYGKRRVEVLEIQGSKIRVLSGERTELLAGSAASASRSPERPRSNRKQPEHAPATAP